MLAKKYIFQCILLAFLIVGCNVSDEGALLAAPSASLIPGLTATRSSTQFNPTVTDTHTKSTSVTAQLFKTPTRTTSPTSTITPTLTQTEVAFKIGEEITIQYLQDLEITSSEIIFDEKLPDRSNYHQHLVSYISEGNKIYGLLTIPFVDPPEGGFKAIVFNHGYIPPTAYQTTERYTAYVDYLARSGFVVFKIDYRGHGKSEGQPAGSYFSPGYTIDAITALKSLQMMDIIDPQGIGMWGHSMAGNLVLRAMLIEPDIKAGVIWAGAVYSYDDFVKFGIDDNTYQPPATPVSGEENDLAEGQDRFSIPTEGQIPRWTIGRPFL